jgi:hypothetical protein
LLLPVKNCTTEKIGLEQMPQCGEKLSTRSFSSDIFIYQDKEGRKSDRYMFRFEIDSISTEDMNCP